MPIPPSPAASYISGPLQPHLLYIKSAIWLPRTRLCRAEGDTVDTVAGRRLEACSGGGSGSAAASRGNLAADQTKCTSISHTYPQCFAWHLQMFQIFSKHSFDLENTTLVSDTPHLCRSH